jgi:hypothetical protein
MGVEQIDYAAILADLEAKRNVLDATIQTIRMALAAGTLGQTIDMDLGVPPSPFSPSFGSSFSNEVPAGAFLGKSIPDAAKLYLEIVKKKQTSREIAEALQKGGMESHSRNFPQMVHSVLDRARKTGSVIVKLDRSHWGLGEWYPASLRGSASSDKRVPKKKAVRKGKSKKAARPAAPHSTAQEPQAKASDRALQFLSSKRNTEHSLEEIAKHLGMGTKGTRLTLGKLVKAEKIRLSGPGMYTAEPFRLTAAS